MKSIKLTPKEREVFVAISSTPDSVLYKHVKPTGTICYRLLDNKKNPVANFREATVQKLIDKDVLAIDNLGVVTKASVE